ncbi:M48 family metallopeptidase [Salinimonas chungwhensis]|uniref:M48 family metallopeptidase n=1 Tax=Salinimonas chungwhensis TaxID=265425 RepID=UPI00035F89BD|nr:M48 family metallopeptidase [Salinimonas chungwhensis]
MSGWIKKTLVVALSAIAVGCATSPTGRNQVLLFPSDQLAQMGQQAFTDMKQKQNVSRQPVKNEYVECIADAITPYVPESVYDGKWEVVVFDEDQVNAFALPGGKIGVYTGLMKVAQTQDQLAAVIGHEIGHVIAQHGNERMSQGALVNIGTQAVGQILAANEVPQTGPIMAAIGLGVQVGVQLPYSRAHESEADLIGLQLMAQAGFNPRESVDLWRNMEAASGGQRPPEIMSTHPAPQSRIQSLQKNMPEAVSVYEKTSNRPDCR